MEQTGAIVNKPNTLMFKRLKEAIKSKIIVIKNAKRIAVFLKEDILNIYFIQELWQ